MTMRRELTAREREVLAQRGTTREIGKRLGIAQKTVAAHRYNLQRKLKLEAEELKRAGGLRETEGECNN